MPIHSELASYDELYHLLEFHQSKELFYRAGCQPFFQMLQGYDEEITLIFARGFDGWMARVWPLTFDVMEELVAWATKLPRNGTRWHKHLFPPCSELAFALKEDYHHVRGMKGFHREWVREEYLAPLTIILRLVTCEGKFTVPKAFHFKLLAHFMLQRTINFPFYFVKSLEKMSSQV